METLEGSEWDVLISGTGIQQSLLALALSRCGKKILHVDKDDVYGGPEAALSLQEAEKWTEKVNSAEWRSPFSHASITCLDSETSKLGQSRSYSLSLAPTLIYTRSTLLLALVSSRAHPQIEFQAVGCWFVFGQDASKESAEDEAVAAAQSKLIRVPNGREDIFADQSLSLKAKGALVRFLRFVATYEEKPEVWEPHKDKPFPDFLSEQFSLPSESHGPLLALSLSSSASANTSTAFALPRIARHLRSMGVFGAGFGAVIPKWGGLSEVAQVGCRAGAVGGAVYVLGKGVEHVEVEDDVEEIPRPELSQQDISAEVSDAIGARDFLPADEDSLNTFEKDIQEQSLDELLAAAGYSVASDEPIKPAEPAPVKEETPAVAQKISVRLEGGGNVRTDYIVGTHNDLPEGMDGTLMASTPSLIKPTAISRSVAIVSASLPALFPPTAEGGVTPAGAVVVFPSGSLAGASAQTPPVHVIAHTSDTGECPQGQTVLYASIASTGEEAFSFLDQAVNDLIATQGSDIQVLWMLRYQQGSESSISSTSSTEAGERILCFPDTPLDLCFDDSILDNVNKAWKKITGDSPDEFMQFGDRNVAAEEDVDDDE